MARDGSGGYSLPTGTYTPNTLADADDITADFADITTAMAASIAKDGQTTPTANLPMGTYKHTGVGAGTARTEYADVGSVQDGDYVWCGTAGGTADAITLSPSPAVTTLVTGMKFRWKASANANTGAATAAISGLSAIAMEINDSALSAGDHAANKYYEGLYDGTALQISKFSAAAAGDVVGPASATDSELVRFDGTTGKLLKSGSTVATSDIADNAVTLAKLNGGTAGRIVVFDSSGDPAEGRKALGAPGPGTAKHSGKVLHQASTLAVTANRLYFFPWYCHERMAFNRIGISVNTGDGAGGTARIGVYNVDDADPTSCTLLFETGTVSTNAAADVEATISQTIEPGWYLLASVFDNTPTMETGFTPQHGSIPFGYPNASTIGSGSALYGDGYVSHTFGALPDPLGGTVTWVGPTAAPAVYLRNA